MRNKVGVGFTFVNGWYLNIINKLPFSLLEFFTLVWVENIYKHLSIYTEITVSIFNSLLYLFMIVTILPVVLGNMQERQIEYIDNQKHLEEITNKEYL